MDTEKIVFVNESGQPTGEVGPKLASHNLVTKLHLAFSCYIFHDDTGQFLMTRRADNKRVWPSVWTNSLCGHPAPGEDTEAAILRRGQHELGLHDLFDIKCVLFKYRYRAAAANGIVENEFCPVYVAKTSAEVVPNPAEVGEYRWLSWKEYGEFISHNAKHASFWARDQHKKLVAEGFNG